MEIPKGMYARLADRSGLAVKGILVWGGVIDSDYQGNIILCLHNSTDKPFKIEKDMQVSQMIFEKHGSPYTLPVKYLSTTT